MPCVKCQHDAAPGALFCSHCGAPFVTPARDGAPDPLLGQTLKGQYFIQEKIADGGMGLVYKAVHVALESTVAVKIVKRTLLADAAIGQRFQREARAASRLRHPNIVAVTDFGLTEDGTLFMVMEYVTGKSLARLVSELHQLPEERVVGIGTQILSGLAEAHAHGILHRDLKPENVMVAARRDGTDAVKILDFGIAKCQWTSDGRTLTQAGLVCGTPGYMSPEQWMGGPMDARSDLYAVGIVLYEMLTGRRPFDVDTGGALTPSQLRETPPPPRARRSGPLSGELEALVMRALAPRPEDRPASAEEMQRALLACAPERPAEEEPRPEKTEVLLRRDTPRASTPAAPGTTTGETLRAPPPRLEPPRPETPRPEPPLVERAEPQRSDTPRPGPPRPEPPRPPTPRTATPRAEARRTETPRLPTPRADTPGPAGPLDPAVVKRIEQRLSAAVGPIAQLLVKRTLPGVTTAAELCQAVAGFIPSRPDRETFLAATVGKPPAAPAPRTAATALTPGPLGPAVAWDAAVLERARRQLASHLGPVAKLVVQRASARARTTGELYELLALELPTEAERETFRRSAPPPDTAEATTHSS